MPYYRRNLLILCTTIFLTSVSWNQVIPFLPLFVKEMGVKGNLLSWVGIIFTLQSAASIIAQPFWGKLGDKFGRKPMAIRAGICLAGIYFGMSLCQTPLQLAILRFLNGALTGFIPMSMALIATNTPEDKAPRSLATAQTASAAGLIIGPAIGGLLAGIAGYRGSMIVSGSAVLISTILVAILVHEKNRPQIEDTTSLAQDFAIAVRSKVLSSVMLTVIVYGIYVASVNPILALHLSSMDGHAPVWLTGLVFSLFPAAMVLTAHMWTRLGEKRGFDKNIRIGLTGGAIAALVLGFVHNVWVFSGVFFVAGLFMAAINPATASIICTRVPADFRGRAYGIQSSASMMGTVVAPMAATRIGDAFSLPAVFIFVGIVALLGSLAFPLLSKSWDSDSQMIDMY